MAIAGMRSEQKKTPFHAGEGRKQPIVQRAILLFPCRERKVFYSLAADVLHSNNYVIVEVNNFRRKFFSGGRKEVECDRKLGRLASHLSLALRASTRKGASETRGLFRACCVIAQCWLSKAALFTQGSRVRVIVRVSGLLRSHRMSRTLRRTTSSWETTSVLPNLVSSLV